MSVLQNMGTYCKDVLSFNECAAKEIVSVFEGKNKIECAVGIKIFVRFSGCQGYKYSMEYVYEAPESDKSLCVPCYYDGKKVDVYVDKVDLPLIKGTKIGFAQSELGSAFTFSNPNEKGRCGCGSSFSV